MRLIHGRTGPRLGLAWTRVGSRSQSFILTFTTHTMVDMSTSAGKGTFSGRIGRVVGGFVLLIAFQAVAAREASAVNGPYSSCFAGTGCVGIYANGATLAWDFAPSENYPYVIADHTSSNVVVALLRNRQAQTQRPWYSLARNVQGQVTGCVGLPYDSRAWVWYGHSASSVSTGWTVPYNCTWL